MHHNGLVDDLGDGEEDFRLDDGARVRAGPSVRLDLLFLQDPIAQLLLSDWQDDSQELAVAYLEWVRRFELVSEQLLPVAVLLCEEPVARLGVAGLQKLL